MIRILHRALSTTPPPHKIRAGATLPTPPQVREHIANFLAANRLSSPSDRKARREYLSSLTQRSRAWHEERLGFVSGSAFHAVVGSDGFKTPADVWDDMFGIGERVASNPDILRGVEHEDDGIAAYQASTGYRVEETGIHQHPHPDAYMIAVSPDGLVYDDHTSSSSPIGAVEIKCPRPESPYAHHPSVPPWHVPQVHGHIQCADVPWCDYVRWTEWTLHPESGQKIAPPGGIATIVRVHRDDHYWEHSLLPALKHFWYHHIVTGIRPL